MTITVEIPEELAGQLIAAGKDPARAALEAIALEGYHSDRLTEAEIRNLLGFDSRMDGSLCLPKGARGVSTVHG